MVVSLHLSPISVGMHELEYVYDSSTVVSSYVPGTRAVTGAVLSEQATMSTLPIATRRTNVDLMERLGIERLFRR